MGRRNTAIKGCHRCKKLVPTATRYCRCGYDFKKPKPDSKGASSALPPPAPKPSDAPETSRRKSERRQRITVKPDFYSPSDYENPFKKVRRRTPSESVVGEDGAKRKRGRPKDLGSGLVKPSIKPSITAAATSTATDSPGTPNADSKDSNGNKRDREPEQIDMYATLPAEKKLQYQILLAELNRKFSVQVFRPT